ncbi:MAG: insulinase family protein, partial [Verrucomicrobiota bacterium]
FANGVKLNLKKTDFEAGRIRLNARVGNGSITEPASQRGLAAIAGSTFGPGGLGKHSADDLRRILAGKNVGWQFRPDSEAFLFSGGTTREDLLLELQYLGALLTDPGYRPEALRQARKGLEQLYLSFEHTANGPLSTEIANLLAGGDPRFGLPAKEIMLSRSLEEVKAWLAPQLARGALELSIVGDLDPDATIAAVAQTLGALPAREPKPPLDELKKIAFPAQPFARDYSIPTEIPKGALALFWPTSDAIDVKRGRRLNLLSSIFSDRLRVKVREEVGGTYSPNAFSNASDTFAGYGYIMANIDVDPAMAGKISDIVITLADELATSGVTVDELNRARQPLLTSMKDSLRSNAYWLGRVLARAQEQPETLDWTRNRIADIESITPEELNTLAKSYLGRSRVSRATILPAETPRK